MLFFVSQATFIKKSLAKTNVFSQSASQVHFSGVKVYLKFRFVFGAGVDSFTDESVTLDEEVALEEEDPLEDEEVALDDEEEDPFDEDEDPFDEEWFPLGSAALSLDPIVPGSCVIFNGFVVEKTIVKFTGTEIVLFLVEFEWVKFPKVWFVYVLLTVLFLIGFVFTVGGIYRIL